MTDSCGPEMMRDHESRITGNTASTESAHKRITEHREYTKGFITEMRESNKNISELVVGITVLANEVKNIAVATERHDQDIQHIKDNMETKDTVLKLYDKMETADETAKKGQDAIMAKLRETQHELEVHKQEPAMDALAREKATKKWLIGAVGAIIASQYLPDIIQALFTK